MDYVNLCLVLSMILIYFFFFIRPQQKAQNENKLFIENLKKGDKLIMASGLYCKFSHFILKEAILVEKSKNLNIKSVDKVTENKV